MTSTHNIIVSFGSNYNHRANATMAKSLIAKVVKHMQMSREMLTVPVGEPPCDDCHKYLNFLVSGLTQLSPAQFTAMLKDIERQCGDSTLLRANGKVAADLDLMLYDGVRYHTGDWQRSYMQQLIDDLDCCMTR